MLQLVLKCGDLIAHSCLHGFAFAYSGFDVGCLVLQSVLLVLLLYDFLLKLAVFVLFPEYLCVQLLECLLLVVHVLDGQLCVEGYVVELSASLFQLIGLIL